VFAAQGVAELRRHRTHHVVHARRERDAIHGCLKLTADLDRRRGVLPPAVPRDRLREDVRRVRGVGRRDPAGRERREVLPRGRASRSRERFRQKRSHPPRQDAPRTSPSARRHRARVRPRVVTDRGPGAGEVSSRGAAPGRVAREEELPGEAPAKAGEGRGREKLAAAADGHRGGRCVLSHTGPHTTALAM